MLDSQREKQPLLEEFGIIILPGNIDEDAYIQMSWSLALGRHLHPDARLILRCWGDGGTASAGLAIADLLRADGNVSGELIGKAQSSSSFIWAACSKRYVYPLAGIGVHSSVMVLNTWEDADYHRTELDHMKRHDVQIAQIYARASHRDADWWLKKMHQGHSACYLLDAERLVKIGMAKAIRATKNGGGGIGHEPSLRKAQRGCFRGDLHIGRRVKDAADTAADCGTPGDVAAVRLYPYDAART
jgi:ATP-dependent protease ClpP protease subunit